VPGALGLVALLLSLAACLPLARPVIKLGLVAPFEGRYRDVGYEVIYAVRLAVREANARGGVAGHTVELVALDDSGDPVMAVEQAHKLALDPLVVGVVGHWLDETTTAAAPAYAEAGLPLLATTAGPLPPGVFRLWPDQASLDAALPPDAERCPAPCGWIEGAAWLESLNPNALAAAGPALWAFPQFAVLAGSRAEGAYVALPAPLPSQSADAGFAERYRALSNGVAPRASAVLAYDAANTLLAALSASDLSRPGVSAALTSVAIDGLAGEISFDQAGAWRGAKAWLYQWRAGVLEPAD
jgi:ABC-type branched-subunit amino acid transport system substrate-binding protein